MRNRILPAGVALLSLLAGSQARAQGAAPGDAAEDDLAGANAACLGCHSDPAARMTFEDGSSISLLVDRALLAASVHQRRLVCTDCHRRNGEYPHPAVNRRSRRDYTLQQYDVCRRCHFANYTRTLEGVHFQLLARHPEGAPVCVDCHGSHDVQPASRPRSAISRRCATCHPEVFAAYARSVHGKALLDEHNDDVPVCTDCHRAHDIADPHKLDFTVQIPTLCGRCHADEGRMRKYGLSTEVLGSYLADFHGATARIYRDTGEPGRIVAVCTDCHGVHEIATTRGRDPGELKANLQKTCARCHAGATRSFPDAWLPHYESTLAKAPLVFVVKTFYRIFIPLILGGLLLQIFLQIWRFAANR